MKIFLRKFLELYRFYKKRLQNHQKLDKQQRCCRGASAKGGGALKTKMAFFWITKTTRGVFLGKISFLKCNKKWILGGLGVKFSKFFPKN